MRRLLAVFVASGCLVAGLAWGQAPSVQSMPPSVVKSVPQSGDTAVDAATTKQIAVTFSKDMADGAWSWVLFSAETFPKLNGQPRYLQDKRTCVIEVALEPAKTYVIWVNSDKHKNFKDTDGNSAIPYLLVFQTK